MGGSGGGERGSLEILVRNPFERQLNPLGPIASRRRSVRPSMKYFDKRKENISLSGPTLAEFSGSAHRLTEALCSYNSTELNFIRHTTVSVHTHMAYEMNRNTCRNKICKLTNNIIRMASLQTPWRNIRSSTKRDVTFDVESLLAGC